MASTVNDDAKDLIDLAIKDAVRAKITEIVFSNLGHSPRPYLNDEHWERLKEEIERMWHRDRTPGSQPHEDNLWVYLTSAEWMNWYYTFFQAVIGVASIAAGFTFSVIVSPLEPPPSTNLDGQIPPEAEQTRQLNHVRRCLSISWLLFVLSLAWASSAALTINNNKTRVMEIFDRANWDRLYRGLHNPLMLALSTATLVGILLPVMAFGASAEAVRAYQGGTGLAAIVLLALVASILVMFWVLQNL
jgi:hypothetical protein